MISETGRRVDRRRMPSPWCGCQRKTHNAEHGSPDRAPHCGHRRGAGAVKQRHTTLGSVEGDLAASITVAVVETRDEGEMSRLKLTNYDVNRIASTHENASGGSLSVLWNGPSAFDSVRCPACSTIRLMDAPHNKKTPAEAGALSCGSDRHRSGDLSIFSRTLYQLSYRAIGNRGFPVGDSNALPYERAKRLATLTGLEPATSAVTGRHANQLRHRAILELLVVLTLSAPATRP